MLRTALTCTLLSVLAACTAPVSEPSKDSPPASPATDAAEGSPTKATPVPKPQVLPDDWNRVPWAGGQRREPPTTASEVPSVLQVPARAQLAYHPTERLDDPDGWAGERIYFLGVDDRWRVLDMADLGLPADSWPGADTYGSGSLSHDGRMWVGHAHGGVVLINLSSGTVNFVAFPADRSDVRHVKWVPGEDVVSAYASPPQGSNYYTFHVDAEGRLKPVEYPGPRTTFDTDGTPTEVVGVTGQRLRITRWTDQGPEPTTVTPGIDIPRSVRRHAFGVFGDAHVALYVHQGWPSRTAAQLWVLDKGTGALVARLEVPATSSIVGWTDDGILRVLLANRRLVQWDPRTGDVRQVLELPGPYPAYAEWAAATVTFAS